MTKDLERFRSLPLAMLRPDGQHERPRLIVAQPYAKSLHAACSGSTYYMARAGIDAGDIDGAFGLAEPGATANIDLHARAALNWMRMRLQGRHTGGYKYVDGYRSSFWRRRLPALRGTDLINNFQLYGRAFHRERRAHDVGAFYYIDGTLIDYLDGYREFETQALDRRVHDDAIAEEGEGYRQADAIIAMSDCVAETLRDRYNVDPGRISIVVPGANLPEDVALAPSIERRWSVDSPFTLGFIGMYPHRKGLDRVAEALAALRNRGLSVRLRVIGRCPPEIAAIDGIDDLGVINKRDDADGFFAAMRGIDLGCVLSRAELSGIATLEYLRLGIPLLGSGAGGTIDILRQGGSIVADPEMPTDRLADMIADLVLDSARYDALRAQAMALSDWSRWSRAMREVSDIVGAFSCHRSTR